MRLPITIPAHVHAPLDYLVDIALVGVPVLLDFHTVHPLALWVPLCVGLFNLLYSVATDYRLGVLPLASFRTHLWLDVAVGFPLCLAPVIGGFGGIAALFHVLMGVGIWIAVLFTDWPPA